MFKFSSSFEATEVIFHIVFYRLIIQFPFTTHLALIFVCFEVGARFHFFPPGCACVPVPFIEKTVLFLPLYRATFVIFLSFLKFYLFI